MRAARAIRVLSMAGLLGAQASVMPAAAARVTARKLGDARAESPADLAHQRAVVDEMIERSGMGALLDRMPDAIRARATEQPSTLPADVAAATQQAIADAYSSARLREAFAASMLSRYDDAKVATIVEWLRSPLAESMTRLEVAAAGPGLEAALQAYVVDLQDAPPSPHRLELIRRLNRAVKASEFATRLWAQEVVALTTIMRVARHPTTPPDQAAIDHAMKDYQTQHGQAIDDGVLVQSLFTYRSVPDEELGPYIAFWESAAGRWFNASMTDAFLAATSGAAREAAQRIAQLVVERHEPAEASRLPATLGGDVR